MFLRQGGHAGWRELALTFLVAMTSAAHAQSASVVNSLAAAGFQCSPATNASGTKFGGTLCTHAAFTQSTFSLSQAVSVFVPSTTTSTVDHIVLYFQGFRGVCGDTGTTPGQVMNTFQLAEQMETDSAANSVLVFPMSVGNDATYNSDFAAASGPFAGFVGWIEEAVGMPSRWAFAGHSGAGAVMARAFTLNTAVVSKFDAIEMLDAAYSLSTSTLQTEWKKIAQLNPSLQVTCIGNGTYSGCQEIASITSFTHPVVLTRTSTAHCDIPKSYFGLWLKSSGE